MAVIKMDQLSSRLKGETLDKFKRVEKFAVAKWSQVAMDEAKLLIVETIQRGQSPVEGGQGQTGGQSRFTDYSPSYKKMITSATKKTGKHRPGRKRRMGSYLNVMAANGKRLRPVNLKVTGVLLRSIKAMQIRNGFKIWFSDKKAKWHTVEGVGPRRIKRKMLPIDPNDKFTRLINKVIVDKFKSILKTYL